MPFRPTSTDALLVIDVQNDFCPGGALAVPDGDAIVPAINRLMSRFDTVTLTQDWHPMGHASFASSHPGKAPFDMVTLAYGEQVLWPDHCVQDQNGAAFHPDLHTSAAQLIVRKGMHLGIDSYSAFFENDRSTSTGLCGFLRDKGITRVFCCGLATDFCVFYSLMDARAQGFDAVLIEDASRGINLDGSLPHALAELAAAGVGVCPSASVLGAA
jgi:nicotinamidase/pyrazinamidase